ncbi:MAG: RNA methyltransferase [Oscillospiraceae bacterium]|nr:RNA methyltransferase [Oscillospiraceae bacterium]
MEKLSSRQNRIISHFRNLGKDKSYREECGEYVCDGEKLLGEALKWGEEITCVLWAETPGIELPAVVKQYEVSEELLQYVSPMKTAPGVIFSVKRRDRDFSQLGKTLVLETIQDPGNLGTILRSANALNIDTVILTGDCADLYNPKTVRAAMGALFRQCVLKMSREDMRALLTEQGYKLYGAALSDKSCDIRSVELKNCAIAVGSEGQGLSRQFLDMCDGEIIIPMNPACESLNAGVAAAIIMWELTR